MKYGSIAMVALLFIGLYSTVQSQSVQTNGLRDRQIMHLPIVGTNVLGETFHIFLGPQSNHRLQTGFMTEIDSLRMKGPSSPFPDDRFFPNGLQRGSNPAVAKLSSQSQISVIDTAIVRSTQDTTRNVYSFNAKAKMTSDLEQKLIGGLWVDTLRTTSSYDAKGNMLTRFVETWSDGQWINWYRDSITYDANENFLSYLSQFWKNGQLVYSYRTTYTYDANGNILSELDEESSNGQWVNLWHWTQTYDANGNMRSSLEEHWSNGQWMIFGRYTTSYDANGNMLSWLGEQWTNGQWAGVNRETYTYDANGTQTSYLDETWSNGQWVNSERYTFTYDANGRQTSYLDETWSNGQWVNGSRVTYTYDANGNRLSDLYETWSNGQWVNGARVTYTYDAQENLTSVWSYTWLNSSWTPRNFWFGATDSAGNGYEFVFRGHNITFIRKLIVTGVASESGNIAASYSLSQNYPNPFNPSSTIRYGLPHKSTVQLTIFNTLGQQVATLVQGEQEAGYHEVRFDAATLSSGVYFYRLQAGTYVETRKLLLLR